MSLTKDPSTGLFTNSFGVGQITSSDIKPTVNEFFRYYTTLDFCEDNSYSYWSNWKAKTVPVIRAFYSKNIGMKTLLTENPKKAWQKLREDNRSSSIRTNDFNITANHLDFFNVCNLNDYNVSAHNGNHQQRDNNRRFISVDNNMDRVLFIYFKSLNLVYWACYINDVTEDDLYGFITNLNQQDKEDLLSELLQYEPITNTDYFVWQFDNTNKKYGSVYCNPKMYARFKEQIWSLPEHGSRQLITINGLNKSYHQHMIINDSAGMLNLTGFYDHYYGEYNIFVTNGDPDHTNPDNLIKTRASLLSDFKGSQKKLISILKKYLPNKFWTINPLRIVNMPHANLRSNHQDI